MTQRKVFIATSSFGDDAPEVLELMTRAGVMYTLNPFKRKLTESEIIATLIEGGYTGLLAGLEPLNEAVLSRATPLKVISRVGVGMDNVDQAAAKRLGIRVYNTPGVLTDAVAELTLGLMLAALRKIARSDREMHSGCWVKLMGGLLKGKCVGLVGFGAIGARVAELVQAFGATVIGADVREVKAPGVTPVAMEALFKTADIISFHASAKTCLLGEKELSLVKPGVIVVNTARGTLIDEKALASALTSGRVACAALDVFHEEPYQGDLLKEKNVILTPHIGSYAKEARVLMERMAVENLLKGLAEADA